MHNEISEQRFMKIRKRERAAKRGKTKFMQSKEKQNLFEMPARDDVKLPYEELEDKYTK
jgi:hypothetical protein